MERALRLTGLTWGAFQRVVTSSISARRADVGGGKMADYQKQGSSSVDFMNDEELSDMKTT